MRVIAYTYEADWHCIGCKESRFGSSDDCKDREGNPVHPVLSTDETPADFKPEDGGYTVCCGDCHEVIRENRYE